MWTLKDFAIAVKKRYKKLWEKRLYVKDYLSLKGHLYVNYAIPYNVLKGYNWGDDINKYLIERISGKKIILYRCAIFRHKHYLCIGSILQWLSNKDAIVWGAGLREISPVNPCRKILAVRGPLTRAELLRQGIDCPKVYGDPVLLLPLYYKPTIEKKHRVGVIPHFTELQNNSIELLRSRNDIFVIKIQHYKSYTDFVDEILSCEYILSSSLHGCITSDAYEIPNIWCRFSDYMAEGNGFKFHDYYESVGKSFEYPVRVGGQESIDDLVHKVQLLWTKNSIEIDKLLASCPFIK